MRKKILILRYAAFGDYLYTLPVIQHFYDEGYDVYLHANRKGSYLFQGDPRISELTHHEPTSVPEKLQSETIEKIWNALVERIQPEIILNLSNSLENTCIADRELNPEAFNMPLEVRRKALKDNFFYGMPLWFAQLSPHQVAQQAIPTPYFQESELKWARGWRQFHKDHFVVVMALNGSTAQKRFPQAEGWAREILERYPDAVIFLCGDGLKQPFAFGNGRVYNTIGAPFRQVLLMARFADYVLGPETGLLVGAGMWKTPKTMLCTSSAVRQCVYPQENDFSLQADLECSPCYRAIYGQADCYKPFRDGLSECSYRFQKRKVMDAIDHIYQGLRYRSDADAALRSQPFRVPEVRPTFLRGPGQDRDVRPGVPGALPPAG